LCETIDGQKLDFDEAVENARRLHDVGTQATVICQQLWTRYQAVCHTVQV